MDINKKEEKSQARKENELKLEKDLNTKEDLVLITIGKKSRYLKRNGEDDFWVTTADIHYFCGTKIRNIRTHVENLKEEGKIDPNSMRQFDCRIGKTNIKQSLPHYSFEKVAIDVAFRVNTDESKIFVDEVRKHYTKIKIYGVYAEPDRIKKADPITVTKIEEYTRYIRLAQIESGKLSNNMLKILNPDYQKVLKDQNSKFYKIKEAKFNYAATGKHGVYIREERFDVNKPNMGLHHSKTPTRTSIKVARNFFYDDEYTNLIELDDGLEFSLKRAVRRGRIINHESLEEIIYETIMLVGFPYTDEVPKLDSDRLYTKHLKLYDDYISKGCKIVLL